MSRKGFAGSTDFVRLYYEIVGEGHDPLFLLSGGPGLSHGELKSLRTLSDIATLVYFDQRGTGKSSKTEIKNYTIEASVEDIENIRKKLGYGSISLLGFSWGSTLAASYALKYPGNVKRLVLVGFFSSGVDVNTIVESIRSRASKEQLAVLARFETEGLYKKGGRYPEEYLKVVQELYAPFTSDPLSVSNRLMKVFANISWDVYKAMWGEESEFRITGFFKNFDIRRRLAEIHVPVLLIIGDSDLVPVEVIKRDAEQIHGSKLVILEDARHFCFLDQPKKFESTVRAFLQ